MPQEDLFIKFLQVLYWPKTTLTEPFVKVESRERDKNRLPSPIRPENSLRKVLERTPASAIFEDGNVADKDNESASNYQQAFHRLNHQVAGEIEAAINKKRLLRDFVNKHGHTHDQLAGFVFDLNARTQAAKEQTTRALVVSPLRLQLASAMVVAFMIANSLVHLAPEATDKYLDLLDGYTIDPITRFVGLMPTMPYAIPLISNDRLSDFIITHRDRLRQLSAENIERVVVRPEDITEVVAGAMEVNESLAASPELLELSKSTAENKGTTAGIFDRLRSFLQLQSRLIQAMDKSPDQPTR